MGFFKAFNRSSRGLSDGSLDSNKAKTEFRLKQISKSECRRGIDKSANCSPYAPCYEACPVFTPPSGSESAKDVDFPSLSILKTREEIIAAVREAGFRNSRVQLMRIVAEHPLDFATAMEAFRDGMKEFEG
jgi:hypothetical protein